MLLWYFTFNRIYFAYLFCVSWECKPPSASWSTFNKIHFRNVFRFCGKGIGCTCCIYTIQKDDTNGIWFQSSINSLLTFKLEWYHYPFIMMLHIFSFFHGIYMYRLRIYYAPLKMRNICMSDAWHMHDICITSTTSWWRCERALRIWRV